MPWLFYRPLDPDLFGFVQGYRDFPDGRGQLLVSGAAGPWALPDLAGF